MSETQQRSWVSFSEPDGPKLRREKCFLSLNRFERSLFKAAVALAALLIVARIGAMLLLAFLYQAH